MECIDVHIGVDRDFYCLFYEELDDGSHLSRIFFFKNGSRENAKMIAEISDWLVSIWASHSGELYGATWDGQIYLIGEELVNIGNLDLLGVTKLVGFSDQPSFLLGEEGIIFQHDEKKWNELTTNTDVDIFSASSVESSITFFCASDGTVIKLAHGEIAVEKLPTNLDLHGICLTSNRAGFVVGDEGVAFKFDDDSWEDISQNFQAFHDVHCFKQKVFATVQEKGIFEISPEGAFSISNETSGYYFSSNNDYCITFNDESVLLYDGDEWVSISLAGFVDTVD